MTFWQISAGRGLTTIHTNPEPVRLIHRKLDHIYISICSLLAKSLLTPKSGKTFSHYVKEIPTAPRTETGLKLAALFGLPDIFRCLGCFWQIAVYKHSHPAVLCLRRGCFIICAIRFSCLHVEIRKSVWNDSVIWILQYSIPRCEIVFY